MRHPGSIQPKRVFRAATWFLLYGFGVLTASVQATTIYVSTTGLDTDSGLSWQAAKKTVTAGLRTAASGDQVWVAAGTYTECITLKSGAGLYGGFAGSETDLGQRNWVTNLTILDGNKGGSVVTSPSGATASTRIDGFTIRNGSGTDGKGCGVYCSNSSPAISNNTITGVNVGSGTGGGIYCGSSSSPVITGNAIVGNIIQSGSGGGIACDSNSSPVISNNTIGGNSAEVGGAVYCSNGSPTISNNAIVGNMAYSSYNGYGGGIYFAGTGVICNNVVAGNFANQRGGGIYCNGGPAKIVNNTIVYNVAELGGGIFDYDVSSAAIVSSNIVTFNSSGIQGTNGTSVLRNNCFYNPNGINYGHLSAGAGDISVDPQLLAAGYGEVHLKANSPCINTGYDEAVGAGWADIDGESRVQGAHVDIGADEFNCTQLLFIPTVIRVSPAGLDTNDGSSWALAKRTVQAGIDAATDTRAGEVWVAAGTYKERIVLKKWAYIYGGFAGAEEARDRRDWTTNATILDGGSSSVVVSAPFGATMCGLDGFTIRNGSTGISCSYSLPSIAHNLIIGNITGIECAAGSPIVSSNRIIGNTNQGILCYSGAATILGNVISRNVGPGIYCRGGTCAIMSNAISGNSGSGILCNYDASPAISNNTIIGNGGGIWSSTSPVISPAITNNIVAFNGSGIFWSGGTATLRNNCVYNPEGANYNGLSPGTGDISADPKLQSVAYGQVHLMPGSPCINAGLASAAEPGRTDLDGEARTQGSRVDIGADEFNGAGPVPFAPTIVRVSPSGTDANDGSSWALAKQTIQAGIDAAANVGGEVWVARGTYNQRFTLKSWAYLYGGFAGSENSREERNCVANRTVLDGGSSGTLVEVATGYRISRVDGFTICNGTGKRQDSYTYGGGLYCISGSPIISNNTICGNAAAYGGAIYCSNTSPAIVNNVIVDNAAASFGGGIYCSSASPTIANNTIVGNNAASGGGVYGAYSASPMISNNIIAFNSSGVFVSGGAPTLTNNCIYNPRGANYTGLGAGSGDFAIDPQLLAINYYEVHLTGGSPCINAGMDSAVQPGWVDVDGEPRIQGAHVDVGADEFNGTVPAYAPRVIRVSPAGNDTNDGSSWALAKLTVQGGIDAASSIGGAEVWVAAGTYNERITLKSPAYVYGGFAGTESSRDQRNWVSHTTIVDAGGSGSVVSALSGYRTSRVDGFTIRNGSATYGGGVYCSSASPVISNNLITANFANGNSNTYGAGIYCRSGSPLISNNTITGNTAASTNGFGYGGGICCDTTPPPTIVNNTITANIGEGVYCTRSSPVISNNTIVGNTGGVTCYGDSTSPAISNNIVAFNGSGVYSAGGNPTLRNNCIYNPGGVEYSGLNAGAGDISADPRLLAVAYGQVHLVATSPCIDAGYDPAVETGVADMDGELRIQGAHVDIGADEFNGTTPVFAPAIIRVSPSGSDANDGSSWTSAKLTVQAGIDAASGARGGEVWVAAGTYNQRISLKVWTYVYGGFAGTEHSRDERNWAGYPTVLDGGAGGSVVSVLFGARSNNGIDGLVIRNGSATRGGGVYCLNSGPKISNNKITRNTADYGGGVFCAGGSPSISGNVIVGNLARSDGGGVTCYSSSLVISNNRILGNSASSSGGGVCCLDSATSVITNNTIAGNGAPSGGAVSCSSGPAISNNILAFNSSGIARAGGTPTLRNNCVYNPDGYNYSSGLSPGTGDISDDPRLVAVGFGEVHLTAASPCIDTGSDAAVQTGWVDFDGEPRTLGGHVDIGADEFNTDMPVNFSPLIVRVSSFGDDASDGSSWALAKRTVQAAIDAASEAGGEVWVAAGIYEERITLKSLAYLYGGFAGTETGREQRDRAANTTTLDGGHSGSVATAFHTGYRLSCLDGFTIQHGTGIASGNQRYGGGIYCRSAPTIANNAIVENAADNGGGIYCEYSLAAIWNNAIQRNTAALGGGTLCRGGAVVVSGNSIAGNVASRDGGAVYCESSTVQMISNVITANVAGARGGGVCCLADTSRIVNCVIVGNHADTSGGGMYNAFSSPTIANCTFSGNSAPSGAALHNQSGDTALTNCIVWAHSSPPIAKVSGSPVLTYCDVQGGNTGSGNIDNNPRFVRSPSPGVDATWGTDDDDHGDLRLLTGSPCIDAGKNAAVPGGVTTDLDGHGRFFNDPATLDCQWAPGTCGPGPIVDMGAYEFIAGDYDRDGDLDAPDLAVFQACISGPSLAYARDCAKADLDQDGDVDLADYGIFQRCYSGAGIQPDPKCAL